MTFIFSILNNVNNVERKWFNVVDHFRQIGPYRRACRVTTTPGATREVSVIMIYHETEEEC